MLTTTVWGARAVALSASAFSLMTVACSSADSVPGKNHDKTASAVRQQIPGWELISDYDTATFSVATPSRQGTDESLYHVARTRVPDAGTVEYKIVMDDFAGPGGWIDIGNPGSNYVIPKIVSRTQGIVDVFASDAFNGGQVWNKAYVFGDWWPSITGWHPLGAPPGGCSNGVTPLAPTENSLVLLCVSAGDTNVYYNEWTGGEWSGWTNIGGGPIPGGSVSAVSRAPGQIDIFANQSSENSGRIITKARNSEGQWAPSLTDWWALPYRAFGVPEVAAPNWARIDMVFTGAHDLAFVSWDAWQGWSGGTAITDGSLAFVPVGFPVARSDKTDIIAYFSESSWLKTWNGQQMSPPNTEWTNIGQGTSQELVQATTGIARDPNRLDVFGYLTDSPNAPIPRYALAHRSLWLP